MDQTHHVDGEGLFRRAVAASNQGLCSQMKDDLWLVLLKHRVHGGGVAQVHPMVGHIAKLQRSPVRRLPFRVKRQPRHLCAEGAQPQHQPRTFEARVPSDEHAPPSVQIAKGGHAQTFQGARPLCQSSSNLFLSRKVSMGRQKP